MLKTKEASRRLNCLQIGVKKRRLLAYGLSFDDITYAQRLKHLCPSAL